MPVRRSNAARLAAAALLGWLSIVTVSPVAAHNCPMHGGGSIAGVHRMHSMAGHGAETRDHKRHSNQCGCPGDCAGTAAWIGLPSSPVLVAAVAERSRAPRNSRAGVFAGRYTPRLLPFANAPPALS